MPPPVGKGVSDTTAARCLFEMSEAALLKMDCFSPNAKQMLHSLIPNLVKKAAHYRSHATECQFSRNVSNFVHCLIRKSYPVSWWKPQLLQKANAIGLRTAAICGIQNAVRCMHT